MFATLASARSSLQGLARDFDPGELSPEGAVRAVAELGAIRRVVDGMLAKAAKRVADTSAHASRGDRSAASLVARSLGVGTGEARSAIETAAKLEWLPATNAAVREGQLSGRQAQMIADAAFENPGAEQELLDAAGQGLVPLKDACIAARARAEDPSERAARQQTLRHFRRWTDGDGMCVGKYRVTPEIGGQMNAKFEAEIQRIFRAHRLGDTHEPHEAYAADALAALVLAERTDSADAPARDPNATVHILIDHGALMRGGAADGEVCEIPGVGPVDVAWVRDLLGSAFVTVVIKRGKDILTVANLGRHVPAEVRTALIVSGRECDIDGCHHRGYLERDHTHDHAKGGLTVFWNLGWLCYVHHKLKTAGWQLGPPDPATRKRTLRPPPARAA
jgi:hypothetical protein